jgi:hypothetical protein
MATSLLCAALWVVSPTTIARQRVAVTTPKRFRLDGLTVVRVSNIEPERPLSVRGVWNPLARMPTKWRGNVASSSPYGGHPVIEKDPRLSELYAACGPNPAMSSYVNDPDWHANWTARLTPYERGLRTLLYGVTDAKAHESWKQRGFEWRNKKAMEVAALSLQTEKRNKKGKTYNPATLFLGQQTYRDWLNEAATDDPARLLGSFVRSLAVVVEAAQIDRPRWLSPLVALPEPKEKWPQDEVRQRATALLIFTGLSLAEAYAYCHEETGNAVRLARQKLRIAREGSRIGELRVPNPAFGLSQSVRETLKPWMKVRQYREFTRLLRTSFHTLPHLIAKDNARSFALPTAVRNSHH